MSYLKLQFLFLLVPSDIITSVTLLFKPMYGFVGDSITAFCNATVSVDVSEALIEFDYRFMSNTVAAVAGTTQTDMTTISPVSISSAGEYTCTVTVTASGVCGGDEPEPACPTKTSDPVSITVQCE